MWLLVMTLAVAGCSLVTGCPDSCSCRLEQGLYVANCSSLPYNAGKIEALTVLPYRDNPQELSDGQFNSARHLKYLSLRNSSIYFIHKKAFYGAKNVIEIDLSFNYIEELEPTVFQHLTSLTTLALRGNPIQFVSEVPFLISNSLQHLDIGQCKIRSISRGIFYGLKRLKYLSLDGNFLKSLKYNTLPKGLKYLNLSHNLIVNIPTEVLLGLTNLRRISLSGNPVNCTCSLMNLQDWLSGRGVIFEDDVTCAFPSEYYGVNWSKVDEKRLCLAEARREEMSQSTKYNLLLSKQNHLKNENSYLRENVQSDQPQPDSQAEVMFQNDETIAMGEMMRDEEDTKEQTEPEQPDLNKESEVKADMESATIGKTDVPEVAPVEPEVVDTNNPAQESVSKNKDEEVVDSNSPAQESVNENKDEEVVDPNSPAQESVSENKVVEVVDPNSPAQESVNENVNEEIVLSANKENDAVATEKSLETDDTNPHDVDNSHVDDVPESKPVEDKDSTLPGEQVGENTGNIENTADLESPLSFGLNESSPVEFKPLHEELNPDVDDFREEGLFHVDSDKYTMSSNDSMEETTIIPDIEDTTEEEEEVAPTQETEEDKVEVIVPIPTSSTEIDNGTVIDNAIDPKDDELEEEEEVIPTPAFIPDLLNKPDENIPENNEPTIVPSTETNNRTLIAGSSNIIEKKLKEVAGAEVVMFCLAVLVICLILYSIYKCRISSKRQSIRISKDVESNRGTEMQDMASLLPKPQDGDKKISSKYPDKAPSSETVQLISRQDENETPRFKPVAEAINKVDDKNSLNNNTKSSPTIKTPLIKPGNPITINPAAPIQRTKVKVGIIPDSIPRTPIFLQKTLNGTKNV